MVLPGSGSDLREKSESRSDLLFTHYKFALFTFHSTYLIVNIIEPYPDPTSFEKPDPYPTEQTIQIRPNLKTGSVSDRPNYPDPTKTPRSGRIRKIFLMHLFRTAKLRNVENTYMMCIKPIEVDVVS